MATPVRRTDPSVAENLQESPWEFPFFQAVRLLAGMHPERRLISEFNQPFDELLRFRPSLSLLFPASQIQSIEPDEREAGRIGMTVNFMGLTGPQGVLPAHYTEYLIARNISRDTAAAAFFDLFNHRLISLFYLAWEKHHFPVAFERESRKKNATRRFTQYLFDLIGLGTPELREALGVDETLPLGYAGLIAQRPHSAVALAGMLSDYFQVPIEVEQFAGQWCVLEQQNLSYLGNDGEHNQLGCGAIAGDQVWNQQARFRVRIGPLNWSRYNEFLPTGSGLSALLKLVRYFVNRAWDFEVQVVLQAQDVPWCELTDGPRAPRLGESTWLKTEPFASDVGDLVMTALAGGGGEQTL